MQFGCTFVNSAALGQEGCCCVHVCVFGNRNLGKGSVGNREQLWGTFPCPQVCEPGAPPLHMALAATGSCSMLLSISI